MVNTLILLIVVLVSACSSSQHATVQFDTVPQSTLQQLSSSHFDRFVVTDPLLFKRYNKVIFFPMQFDRLTIDLDADKDSRDSWSNSSWQEMDNICQYFDDFQTKFSVKEMDLYQPDVAVQMSWRWNFA